MAQITGMPVYQDNVRELESADPGAPATFNPNNTVLINNDVYLKQRVDNAVAAAAAIQAKFASASALYWGTRFI